MRKHTGYLSSVIAGPEYLSTHPILSAKYVIAFQTGMYTDELVKIFVRLD